MSDEPRTSIDSADSARSLADFWSQAQEKFPGEFGEVACRNWLGPMVLQEMQGSKIILSVPTNFLKDWIVRQYSDRLLNMLHQMRPEIRHLEILVVEQTTPMTPSANLAPPSHQSIKPAPIAKGRLAEPSPEDGWTIDVQLDPRFTFSNFVVGKPNELAYNAAMRVAENEQVTFNPLFLYGGVGLGKTHLMHAIAWKIRETNPNRRVIYLSAEAFMFQFIKALRFKDTMGFKEQFRSVDVLMIDDVQFICGKESTQEEFFHTFNALVDQNRQIILSADKSPSDLAGLEERLRSRLGWGLVADIHPTSYELRLGILQAKAEQRGTIVPPKVLEFLAHKISSNVRELEGALTRVIAHATLVGREITLESTQEVLSDLLRSYDRRVTIDDIQKMVAQRFNIKLSEMHSDKKSRILVRPRQVAMYLSKQLTSKSLPEIGQRFGGRDHTTVIHAVKKVEELCAADPAFAEDVSLLKRILQGQG